MRQVAKWTGILGFVFLLLLAPVAVAAQTPVTASRLALVPAPGSPFAVSYGADTVLTGDLNRDGKVDLVVGDRYTRRGIVFFGRGDGAFAPAPVPPVSVGGRAVDENGGGTALTDVSGDGVLDLVLVCGGGVSVQRGRGDGTFVPTGATIDGTCGREFFLADLTGSGVRDAISGTGIAPRTYTPITLYRGQRDGGFASPQVVAPPGILRAVRDLDGNSVPDLYATFPNGPNPGAEFTYRGNGDGTFTAATLPQPTLTGILLADVDGDGILDRVGGGTDRVAVARGHADGTFDPFVHVYTFPTCVCDVYILGDTNGDGASDIAVRDYESGRITVLVLPRPTALPVARAAPPVLVAGAPAPAPPSRPALPTVAPQPAPRAIPPMSPPPTAAGESVLPRPLPPRR